MTDHTRFDVHDDVGVLTLDRPDRLNAMTAQMCREIQAVLSQIDGGGVRALVLRGEGRAFCSGADLAGIVDDVDVGDPEAVRRFMVDGWQRVIATLRALRVPTVAAVQGAAFGGGANLALACDLVVASESAVFCQAYVDRGIPPDLGATWVLPTLVGPQQARRLLMLGEQVGASEALKLGMVLEVVPDGRLDPHAMEIASDLAGKDAMAVALIRDLLSAHAGAPLSEALDGEAAAIAATLGRPEFHAAIEPYLRR